MISSFCAEEASNDAQNVPFSVNTRGFWSRKSGFKTTADKQVWDTRNLQLERQVLSSELSQRKPGSAEAASQHTSLDTIGADKETMKERRTGREFKLKVEIKKNRNFQVGEEMEEMIRDGHSET